MDLGLAGKRVIVTGASKGIGLAIARSFLDEGAQVSICSRGDDALSAAADDLARHGSVHHRTADMADPDAPASFVNWAADAMGGLDVLVSNVSGFGRKRLGVVVRHRPGRHGQAGASRAWPAWKIGSTPTSSASDRVLPTSAHRALLPTRR